MSTSGLYGFKKGGKVKASYHHGDGYPEYLGDLIVKFINSSSIEEMNSMFDNIVMVNQDIDASKEQVDESKLIIDTYSLWTVLKKKELEMLEKSNISKEEKKLYKQFIDYKYDPLKVSSGKISEWYVLLRPTQGDLSIYRHGLKYMLDGGLPGEMDWSYIINLDTNEFEIYNCSKIIKTYPLNNIPKGLKNLRAI